MDRNDGADPDESADERDEDRHTEQVRIETSWEDDGSPAMELVRAVAAVTGTPPERLPPLYDVVDPDAFDDLLRPGPSSRRDAIERSVSFTYENCDVTVRSTGEITVTAPEDDVGGSNSTPRS